MTTAFRAEYNDLALDTLLIHLADVRSRWLRLDKLAITQPWQVIEKFAITQPKPAELAFG